MTVPVIVVTARSPIGRAGRGSLTSMRADDLASQMVAAAPAQIPELDATTIDDLYHGAWEHTGEQGENIARRVAGQLGLAAVPGASVERACASSVQTTRMAANSITAGDGDVFVSAAVACVSRSLPAVVSGADRGANPLFDVAQERTRRNAITNQQWTDPRDDGALPDLYISMGQTAENVATYRGVSRREQDGFALRSHQRAAAATVNGFFERDITPVTLPDGTVIATDDGPRPTTDLAGLAGRHPAFREEGTVTAGNECPSGATGARITTTLLHALQERDKQFGQETMCVGGGQSMAIIFGRLS